MGPFEIVKDLEDALCEFTNSPFCVTVNSCTNALGICLEYAKKDMHLDAIEPISIPTHTYIGVPMQIKRAGFDIVFNKVNWWGAYELSPLNIWDSARRFEHDLFNSIIKPSANYKYICLSFHISKILGFDQGGAILHNNPDFDVYARKMRFDGRTEGISAKRDYPDVLGRHCYMSPTTAAGLLWKLSYFDYTQPTILPNSDYPDLSQMDIFK